jgi:hypothetical protein
MYDSCYQIYDIKSSKWKEDERLNHYQATGESGEITMAYTHTLQGRAPAHKSLSLPQHRRNDSAMAQKSRR